MKVNQSLMAALTENMLIVNMLLSVFFLPGALADYCGPNIPALRITTPNNTEALTGSCLQIPCTYETYHPTYNSSKTIYGIWMKGGVNFGTDRDKVIFNSSGLINNYSLSITGNLKEKNCTTLFPNLTTSHTDIYFFRVENGDYVASACADPLQITVKDSPWSPSIDVPSDLKEHQSVTVTCSAFTPCPQSPPELTWNLQQDSLRQTEKNTDGTFTTKIQKNITLSDTHDGYNIRCSARHPVIGGNKTAETEETLSVSYAPRNTSASISPSGLVSAGSWVELSCSSRAKPPPSFTWFRNNKDGVTNVSMGPVYGLNVTEEGEFYCVAKNDLGNETSSRICVSIKDSPWSPSINLPSDLKEHQSVTVTCSASTPCPQSPPELTWNLQQDSLRQTEKNTDGTFTTKIQENITLSDTHDGYNISCSARYPVIGGIKTAETEETLSVSYAPRNTSASISPSGLVSAGSRVELNCSSRAKPPPSFTWFRNSKQGAINVSVGPVYSFNVTEGGEYYCLAINNLGNETSSRLCVGIKDSPWSPSINLPSDLKEHQSVTVTCSAFTPCPQSLPELTWNLQQDSLRQTEKNTDETFTTKIQENITLSDTHDGYNIRCSARYPVILGNKTEVKAVMLNVSYAPRNTSASISPSGLVSTGSWVELSCSSRAKPPPNFTWFRNSEHGTTNISMEQVYSFNVPEGGEYHCVATNHLGKERSSVILVTMKGEKLLVPVTVGIIVVICFLVFLVVSVWYFMSKHSAPQKLQSQMDIDLGVQNPAFEQEEELHYGEIKVIKKAPIVSLIPVQDNEQQETIYAQVKVSTPENPSTQPDDSPENNYAEVKKK
ncbi:vascular cell adhesion protein 1-like isoform X2 [Xiphophorus couchianus]|uniref:vascular cell adhesion protein 1-like isoform X2 n=1 Tax=Xiphophorus couchianus TaxID=32473 RepID=UPI001016024C|nr:vascular cell adhesion protein 1-like isoform X2 [Xiphophorus couchianus]XP_027860367.1 vascular cell adhesion protein 1-like isoform X2 [Xiphophorus couchianus]